MTVSTSESGTGATYHHGDLKRALVDAALAMVTEDQDWGFSLRAVARRAGVSHNAPYNHFPDKGCLLAAVAALGFDRLRDRMREAGAHAHTPEAALVAIGSAYVQFGVENAAHYRLMFGPALAAVGQTPRAGPAEASASAKSVLRDCVLCCARADRLSVSADDTAGLDNAVLSAWSLVHGLTMLVIDGRAGFGAAAPVAERVATTLLDGLRAR